MKDFREVKVWQQGHRLAVAVYRATAKAAESDVGGVAEHMRRSSAALSANLVSANLGQVRGVRTDPEFAAHMRAALASAAEFQNALELARDLELVEQGDYRELEREVSGVAKSINSFLRSVGPDRY